MHLAKSVFTGRHIYAHHLKWILNLQLSLKLNLNSTRIQSKGDNLFIKQMLWFQYSWYKQQSYSFNRTAFQAVKNSFILADTVYHEAYTYATPMNSQIEATRQKGALQTYSS